MGEVYKATDTRLDRSVAIKVLPAHLSANPEIRQRFEREARAVSSLNHPNICTLFDVGHEEGIDYLVMEHIEGETVSTRLERGPIPVPELIRIAGQIADALDKAHKSGFVHRDLKPSNIMLTKSGAKLLDFGLARATTLAPSTSDLSSTPTLTRALTVEGTLVGTFQYMSPEQLEGKEADTRSDLFAFGAVLYEMATGRRAFDGNSQAGVIASIMKEVPRAVSQITPQVPPPLERLIEALMAKDPDERIQTAHDVRLQLRWLAEGGSQVGAPIPGGLPLPAARRSPLALLPWALFAAAAATAVFLGMGRTAKPSAPAPAIRFEAAMPKGLTFVDAPKVSPDGRAVAYNGVDSTGTSRIYIHWFNSLAAQPLAGTDGTARPFWSPDSRFLAFFADGKLKKVPVAGGPTQIICDAATGADGAWGSKGVIVFDGRTGDPLQKVPASGGIPEVVASPDTAAQAAVVGWPTFLPDGERFLYLEQGPLTRFLMGTISGARPRVVASPAPSSGRFEYSSTGHLVYARERTLVAHPFDTGKLQLFGEPVPIAEGVGSRDSDNILFSCSAGGVLVHRSSSDSKSQLAWLDRNGRLLENVGPPDSWRDIQLSPDGRRLAVGRLDPRGSDDEAIWVRDLERGVLSKVTFLTGPEIWPVWSPDGRWISFVGLPSGNPNTYRTSVAGTGVVDSLLFGPAQEGPTDWSPDGRWLLIQSRIGSGRWDLLTLPSDGGSPPRPYLASPFGEFTGRFSPDGRHVVYGSNESGRSEIYLQSFPEPTEKWQISSQGGSQPRWRRDGRELFYLAPDGRIMAVSIDTGGTMRIGTPETLFFVNLSTLGFVQSRYDVSADGQRFIVNQTLGERRLDPALVTFNWPGEMSAR